MIGGLKVIPAPFARYDLPSPAYHGAPRTDVAISGLLNKYRSLWYAGRFKAMTQTKEPQTSKILAETDFQN